MRVLMNRNCQDTRQGAIDNYNDSNNIDDNFNYDDDDADFH